MSRSLLGIYLNDHLALATAERELALRSLQSNRGTRLARDLEQLAGAIDDDREALERTLRRLEVSPDRLKVGAGWLSEKLGRLKPNGRLRGYSPLSRVVELEGLLMGTEARMRVWRTLEDVATDGAGERWVEDVRGRADRAARHRRTLETHRRKAAAEALHVGSRD